MHTFLIRVVLIGDVHTSTFIEPMSSGQALCIDTQGNRVDVALHECCKCVEQQSTIHNPFSPSQKEILRETNIIQEPYDHQQLQYDTPYNCCINTTTKRQIELCNSKNKMEQNARYLLHNTEHTTYPLDSSIYELSRRPLENSFGFSIWYDIDRHNRESG